MAIRPRIRNLYYLKLVEPKCELKNVSAFKHQNIQQWLDDLPAANMGMLTRLFHDKLIQINITHIDFQQQFEALEALQPINFTIQDFLHSRISGQAIPLDDNVQKIVALQIQILHEYANAYWYLVKNGNKKLGNRTYHKFLPVLLQRLMRLLSNILVTHYLSNLTEPTWIWMDIHSLFNVLPQKVSENTKIKEYYISGEVNTTIADTYKQIIALSTADPYGMYDREILRINHFLSKWVSAIKLEKIVPNQIPLGYYVCMDNDKAPSWADTNIDLDEDSDFYQIYLDDMIKIVNKKAVLVKTNLGRYFSATAYPVPVNCFDPVLLQRMFDKWQGALPKQPVKFDQAFNQDVTIGLKAISQNSQIEVNQNADPVFTAEVISRNSLKCTLDSGKKIAIGSLVGFRKTDSENKNYALGIVSRMFTPKSDNIILFELKNITNTIHTANIELLVDNKKKLAKQKADNDRFQEQAVALTYIRQDKVSNRHYLIIESRAFKENDTIIVNEPDHSYQALLVKQKNLGIGYVVFEYQPDEIVEEQEPMPAAGYDFL